MRYLIFHTHIHAFFTKKTSLTVLKKDERFGVIVKNPQDTLSIRSITSISPQKQSFITNNQWIPVEFFFHMTTTGFFIHHRKKTVEDSQKKNTDEPLCFLRPKWRCGFHMKRLMRLLEIWIEKAPNARNGWEFTWETRWLHRLRSRWLIIDHQYFHENCHNFGGFWYGILHFQGHLAGRVLIWLIWFVNRLH